MWTLPQVWLIVKQKQMFALFEVHVEIGARAVYSKWEEFENSSCRGSLSNTPDHLNVRLIYCLATRSTSATGNIPVAEYHIPKNMMMFDQGLHHLAHWVHIDRTSLLCSLSSSDFQHKTLLGLMETCLDEGQPEEESNLCSFLFMK